MNLKRIKDLPKDFPVKIGTLYKWHHTGRFPDLLVKFGGGLCIDLDQIPAMAKTRNVTLEESQKS